MKKNILFYMVMVVIMVLGCNDKPKISEIFKTQLIKFLEAGAKTNAEASQGVSFMELREQIANTVAAYDLLSATWPADFAVDCRGDFEKALKGWDLTLDLWKLKVNESDNPTEPDHNGYIRYLAFGGDLLVLKIYDDNFIVEQYRGKKYMPFDDNISVLLTIAGSSFNSGRDKILREIE